MRSLGVAQPELQLWETLHTLRVAQGRGNGGGEDYFDIFWVVGEEDRVDSVDEGFRSWDVETLGDAEAGDILGESPALS